MKKNSLLFFLLILAGNTSFAQIKSITQLTDAPVLYEKIEISINLLAKWNNPYLQEDVALDMLLLTPSQKKITLPCYYESGESGKPSTWKARFAPQEEGAYTYCFEFRKSGKIKETSEKKEFNASKSGKPGFLHVRDSWTLQFDNNSPFRGIGENICWESRDQDDSKFFKELHEMASVFNYEYMLPKFAENGGNFTRIWICSWNLPFDYKGNFNNSRYTPSDEFYNPSALKKMDRLFELSDSLQLYIMLTLGQGGFMERDGGLAKTAEDFFINPKVKERYKNRLRYIVARWGYSTSIAMWEFFNEVDNVQFRNKNNPIKGEYIVDWHDEMSRYLKSIDPYNHIVTTSISHRDIEGLNSIENIDINQKHIYNATTNIPNEINEYTTKYNKPYIIGEFGYEWDWSKNFNDFAYGMEVDFKRGLWYGLFSPTPVTPMSWWWEFFDNRHMTTYFKGIREISDKMLQTGNGSFEPITVKAGDAETYGLKCGENIFIYIFNPENRVVISDIVIEHKSNKTYHVQSYEPTTMVYENLGQISNLTIKNIAVGSQKEMVFILSPK